MKDGLHGEVMRRVLSYVAQEDRNHAEKLASISHLLGKYRCELIKRHLIRQCGLEVQSGPFAGMTFLDGVAEGCWVPKLLGTYESELHGTIEGFKIRRYECLVNIGSAEGYYAVGLARLFEALEVYAYDENAVAQTLCRKLAERNGLADRLHIGGRFQPGDFAHFAGRRVLVWCDIEGGELDLLDPGQAPALAGFDILVEMHDTPRQDTSAQLPNRFAATHRIQIITHSGRDPTRFPALQALPHLDQLLAVWEWRGGPTPWAFMQARSVG